MARIHPFCKTNNNNIGYYSGKELFPRIIGERNEALYLYNNHFCLKWKPQGVNLKKHIDELKSNFKNS